MLKTYREAKYHTVHGAAPNRVQRCPRIASALGNHWHIHAVLLSLLSCSLLKIHSGEEKIRTQASSLAPESHPHRAVYLISHNQPASYEFGVRDLLGPASRVAGQMVLSDPLRIGRAGRRLATAVDGTMCPHGERLKKTFPELATITLQSPKRIHSRSPRPCHQWYAVADICIPRFFLPYSIWVFPPGIHVYL